MLHAGNASTMYISPSHGAYRNSGFEPDAKAGLIGPYANFGQALGALIEMRRGGNAQPITLALEGDFFLDGPIHIGPEINRLTITSYPGTRARIIGGRKLTGFVRDTFQGSPCFSLFIPEVKSGQWNFSDLYVNGKRARPARYPWNGTLEAVTTEFPKRTDLFNGSHWFIAKKEDLAKVSSIENATVNFYHYWIDEHTPITRYDPETGRIDFKYRSAFEITTEYDNDCTSNMHYYLENVPEGFHAPDDWFLDVDAGMLYYLPADDTMTPENIDVFAPRSAKLFEIEGTAGNPVCDISLVDLDLFCTRGDYGASFNNGKETLLIASDIQSVCGAYGAVNFKYASACSMQHCRLYDTGLHGVNVEVGCNDIRIEKNLIHDMGAGGVRVCGGTAGCADSEVTSHIYIRGNRIGHGGQRYAAGCGILIMHASYCELSDNDISFMDYSGVSVGWVWGYAPSSTHHNRIRCNHIHHIGNGLLSDMGGIYTLGVQAGTVLEGNVIHDVHSNHYGGWGIYTDEGSSYILIQDNLVFDTKTECFHQHYGSYNTVRRNIFAFGGDCIIRNSRPEAQLTNVYEFNTIITKGHTIYNTLPYSMQAHDNILWDVDGKPCTLFETCNLQEWQTLYGRDEGTVEADPHLDIYALANERIARFDTVEEF